MVYILTPTRARFEMDIKTRKSLLDNTIKGQLPTGFEVILLGGPEGDLKHQDTICSNLDQFSSDEKFFLSMHAPIEREDYEKASTDLTTEEGIETLVNVLNLAKKINAKLVNIHSERFYFGRDLINKDLSLEEKKQLQDKVKSNILEAKTSSGYNGIITIENMPYPLMRDMAEFNSVENMVFDPLMNLAEDILYFADTPGIDICIDTCHYGIMQKKINQAYFSGNSNEELKEGGIFSCYPLQLQPHLSVLGKKLGDKLKYLHFSDFKGIWIPQKSFFYEGIVPGGGEYEPQLRDLIQQNSDTKIPINVEVKDLDFKDPKESEKAMQYLLKILT